VFVRIHRGRILVGLAVAVTGAAALVAPPAGAALPSSPRAGVTEPERRPTATGAGGAVASVDPYATRIGIEVLRRGGNAADAAIATAAALGVTEPYSSGIGGGGFLVYYDAKHRRVSTIDGRETAPASFTPTVFTDGQGHPLDFATVVSSGLSVGVPGTPALWDRASKRFGTRSLNQLLKPAEQLARNGFVVDSTFNAQTAANAARFALFPETARVYLPGGSAPAVGSVFRNPDLARSYRVLRTDGVRALYRGGLGAAVVDAARSPATAPGASVYPGQITRRDLRAYDARVLRPTQTRYRGLDVYGMPVPSSGGIATGEALNLLEAYDRLTGQRLSDVPDTQYLHRLGEASATAFADRNRWIGSVPGVPAAGLLSQRYAKERACQLFSPTAAHPRPIPFGSPDGSYNCPGAPSAAQPAARDDHGTTHLTVTDRWGNVASYTLTIEQTGGSGITVPGYGFLLNNELTDFNFVPLQAGVPDPNLPAAGKRPRSSMSPTIMLRHGRPYLALGSPGGATIITTTLQVATEYLDRHRPLVDAIAAPRFSSRNGPASEAEPGIFDTAQGDALRALGHTLTRNPEIGAATAIRILPHGRFTAAAETTRRGGGAAAVVHP
jgi:gamma-glutamyltranspeptidase / glutathione hydrolase